MSYAFTDGKGREVWARPTLGFFGGGGDLGYDPRTFDRADRKLIKAGELVKDTDRYSGKRAPALTLEEKNQGVRWEQVGVRKVPASSFDITNVAGQPGFVAGRGNKVKIPIWQRMGGSTAGAGAGAASAAPTEPFTPSQDLVDAKTRAQAYQTGGSAAGSSAAGSSGRIPDFSLTGGALFNELFAQGASQTDDYQQRFIPQLTANALLNSAEVSEATQYHLGRFIGKVPEVADAREAFDYYASKVKGKSA